MSAATIPGKIYDAIAARTQAMATDIGLLVSMPNVRFDPPTRSGGTMPYLRMQYMPNGSSLDGLPFDGDETYIGLLQVSVYWPAGQGLVKPTDIANRVKGWWPAGLAIYTDDVLICVDNAPVIATYLQESDLLQIPVTVRWRASEIKA